MFKKQIVLLVLLFVLLIVGSGCKKNTNLNPGLSDEQQKAELAIGEGVIHLTDPYLKTQLDVDFVGKTASVKPKKDSNDIVNYKINDVLQPVNLDDNEDKEYPFLLEGDYSDGKKMVYLVIADKMDDHYLATDLTTIGNPDQIKDLHSTSDKEITIDTVVDSPDGNQSVILAYTFAKDKIIPGKNNIDITKPITKKVTPTPSITPKNTNSSKDNSSSGKNGMVALTFDDGPGVHTPEILSVLADEEVKATFFMIGQNAESKTNYVRQVSDAGHEIGNHTYDHQDMKKLSYDKQKEEITHTNQILSGISSSLKPHWFRPPYGSYNDDTMKVLSDLGMERMLWNVDTRDWSGIKSQDIIDAVLKDVKPGSIILMHDGVANSSETAKALPTIIKELKNRGYKMVTISEIKK